MQCKILQRPKRPKGKVEEACRQASIARQGNRLVALNALTALLGFKSQHACRRASKCIVGLLALLALTGLLSIGCVSRALAAGQANAL